MKNEKDWKKWIFWFSLAISAIAVYKLLDNFTDILNTLGSFVSLLKPFLLAGILSYLLYIPCKKIENSFNESKLKILRKKRRGLSVLTVYVIGFIVIFIIINFIVPAISKSITELANNIPNYYNRAIEFFENAPEGSITEKISTTDLVQGLKNIDISELVKNLISLEKINSYIKGIMGATGAIFDLFVTIVVSIYLLLERKDIKNFLKNVCKASLSDNTYNKIKKYYSKTNNIFYNYVSSQILDALIVGVIVAIAMSIMKIKYGVILGFMVGLFNLIPYFGAIFGVGLATIITIFTGGFSQAIWLAIITIILQQIDANIINPKILGTSLSLSPILVIFGVTVGGAYFGVLGMFLGVPIVALLKIIIIDVVNEKNEEKEKIKNKKLKKSENVSED
jgi:predicted PurR-regulated permease PerM